MQNAAIKAIGRLDWLTDLLQLLLHLLRGRRASVRGATRVCRIAGRRYTVAQ